MVTTSGSEKQSPQRHDSTQSSAVRGDLSVSSAAAPFAAPQAAAGAAGSTASAVAAQRGGSGGSSSGSCRSSSSSSSSSDYGKKKRKKKQNKQNKQKKQKRPSKLWCAVVGRPGCLAVLINEDKDVGDLQDAILKKQKYFGFPASEMNLFLAKDGDSWLAPTHEDGVALRKGEVNGSIEVRLRDKPLSSMDTIGEAIADAGLELPPPAKHIHVLVMLPTQQTTGSRAVAKSGAGDEMEEKAVTPSSPVWKTERELLYKIPRGAMYFVNRDAAIEQLVGIHREQLERISNSGVGVDLRVPIADNVFGLGKTELGRHYIRKCRETWTELAAKERIRSAGAPPPDSQIAVPTMNENRDSAQSMERPPPYVSPTADSYVIESHDNAQPALTPPPSVSADASLSTSDPSFKPSEPLLESDFLFWETLCACHTVRIDFDNGALFWEDSSTRIDYYHKVMVDLLKIALDYMFEVPPRILTNPPSHSSAFLRAVTKEVGPLFIVLDEIGRPFDDPARPLRALQQRELFMLFCNVVLLSWMKIPGVFFVLLGRADFLSYVGLRPSGPLTGCTSSPFKFERLRLNLLRPAEIATIMKKTRSGGEMQSLQMFYGLDDAELMDVANYLFMATNGHPRTLMNAFTRCQTLKSLKSFVGDSLNDDEKRAMMQAIQKYRTDVEKLVKIMQPVGGVATSQLQSAVETVNMSEPIEDAGGKLLTLDIIAQNCFIAWEGTLEQATVYASPQVEEILARLTQPFRTYAAEVARLFASGYVSLNYAVVFEWMCLKRFQELFAKATTPEDALPDFFAGSKFGVTKNVCFSQVPIVSAKITARGSSASVATLSSATAAPKAWTKLLEDVLDKLPVTLKPQEASASADAILFCRKDSGAAPSTLMEVLTVGLAVKNYKPATMFGLADLKHECEIFNCMFDDDATRAVFQTNVLVLCVTSYIGSFMKMFSAEKIKDEQRKAAARTIGNLRKKQRELPKFSHITEVIFLDLTTSTNRAAFFGYNTNDEVFGCLEKIIDKPNRESENQELERKQNVDE